MMRLRWLYQYLNGGFKKKDSNEFKDATQQQAKGVVENEYGSDMKNKGKTTVSLPKVTIIFNKMLINVNDVGQSR
jgi:hypothetical protein